MKVRLHHTGTVQPPLASHTAANTVQACHDRLQVPPRSCPVVLGRPLHLGLWSLVLMTVLVRCTDSFMVSAERRWRRPATVDTKIQ